MHRTHPVPATGTSPSQVVLGHVHLPEDGREAASNLRSVYLKLYSEDLQVQNSDAEIHHVTNQIQGQGCNGRSKGVSGEVWLSGSEFVCLQGANPLSPLVSPHISNF